MEATPSSSATPRAKFRSRLAFWERGTGLLAQTLNITSTPGPAGPARMPLAPVALNTESSPAQAGGFKSLTLFLVLFLVRYFSTLTLKHAEPEQTRPNHRLNPEPAFG